MNEKRDQLKSLIPAPLLTAYRETKHALDRAGQWPLATYHPWRRETIRRLGELRDIHQGKRCFIIGNGPSLKETDLQKLRGEFTIGMNRIYMLFPELGFSTTYFCSVNDLVIEQCAADIQKLDLPRFVSWRARQWLSPQENLFYLYTTYTGPRFTGDIRGRLWEGGTVTCVALQVAFHLGFEKVILIGVDHNFATKGKPNSTVVSQGDDPNHFHPGYFGKGFRWQLPDLDSSEHGYRLAREAYERAGRQVVDATMGGKLQIFPKVNYDGLF